MPHVEIEIYSDSPVLRVIIVYRFEVHKIGSPFSVMTIPVVHRIKSLHPAQ